MKKVKKLIVGLLTATVAMAGFTGCSSKQESAEPVAPEQTKAEAPVEVGEIGTPSEPINVKILIKDVPPTEEGVIMLKEKIEKGMAEQEKYVTLEFLEAPTGTYKEVVPLALRTGEILPDLVYFQGGDLPIAQEGLLEDLTSYIEGSTYVKQLMQEHNKESMKNYPYLLWLAPPRVAVPVMRKDWAEQLTSAQAVIENPTVDNYYALFKEMVNTGLTKYATTTDGSLTKLDSIFNHAFGVTGTFMKEDGKWIPSMISQPEKDKLEFYAKLYQEGLLDSEYITTTWDVFEQRFYEGTVGLVAGTQGGVIQIYNDKMVAKNGEQAELIVLPPAKGVGQAYLSVDTTKESRGFAIPVDSEAKDAAFAILEYMASPQGRMLDKMGIEGVHYNIEDGKIAITDKFSEWWARFWDTLYTFDAGMPYVKEPFSAPMLQSLENGEKYYYEDTNIIMPEELQGKWDAIVMLYNEYSTDIVRGVKPISAFDEFVQKVNQMGGQELSEYLATVLE